MSDNKVTIYIDGDAVQVDKSNNLLAGVLSVKLDLPYFCWHPSMGSVGACRQCAVTLYQDEDDKHGRIVMACTTPVVEGMRVSLKDKHASDFREEVIAAMMTNHPHDCPVCAEGGECHLQDMTVMTGHSVRSYTGEKRTFSNQNLGQFVGHEMNRCITCYRCVRYYKDYAGGDDFGVFGSKNQVYFGRHQSGQLTSEFSGNLVEICPTGVFTNKLFSEHYARKWDLQSAPSVCQHCSVGCNISVGERYGSVRRVVNRFHPDVNQYFLCDHGRYGIGHVNSLERLVTTTGVSRQSPQKLQVTDVEKALSAFIGEEFIGIGSPRSSLEANTLLKHIVGAANFSLGLAVTEHEQALLHAQHFEQAVTPSLTEVEKADCLLIIDEDITQSAPRIALSVRQAIRNKGLQKAESLGVPAWQDSAVRTIAGESKTPLFILSSHPSKLDELACQVEISGFKDLAVTLAQLTDYEPLESTEDLSKSFLSSVVKHWQKAVNPIVICGWDQGNIATFKQTLMAIKALAQLNTATKQIIVPPQVNSVGQLTLLDDSTLTVHQAWHKAIQQPDIAGVIVLENELASLMPSDLETLKDLGKKVIVIDSMQSKLSEIADFVLPSATFSESQGHVVNYEGRIQAFMPALPSVAPTQENWRWLNLLDRSLKPSKKITPKLESFTALHAHLRQLDKNWPITEQNLTHGVARETHRASGRTAKSANQSVHEPKVTQSSDDYRFSMEGVQDKDSGNMPYVWSPGWNSNQAISKFQQEVNSEYLTPSVPCFINSLNDKAIHLAFSAEEHTSIPLVQPWYTRQFLTHSIPEFQLLAEEAKLIASPDFAHQQNWEVGQWLKVDCLIGNVKKVLLARLQITQEMKGEHYCLALEEFVTGTVIVNQLSGAIEGEVQAHLQARERLIDKAKQRKIETLDMLQQRDEYIPIRLVAGGIDDV